MSQLHYHSRRYAAFDGLDIAFALEFPVIGQANDVESHWTCCTFLVGEEG